VTERVSDAAVRPEGEVTVSATGSENEQEKPVVRDRRRIDPRTGAVRPDAGPAAGPESAEQVGAAAAAAAGSAAGATAAGPAAATTAAAGPVADVQVRIAELEAQVAERTADLQRLQAEYVNYRRRVERDREAVRELALISTLHELLPILDDIGRARDHGELTGGFKVVAEALETTLAKLGLERFGDEGDTFDPKVHEALLHEFSPDVAEPTCVQILQPGYRVGERIISPARVKVAEPEPYDPSGGETVSGPVGDAAAGAAGDPDSSQGGISGGAAGGA
jgi:molecular chaperone GrpE